MRLDVLVLDVTTRSSIEGGATVAAGGSVEVAAEEKSEIDVIGGNVAGGTAAIGGSAGVPIIVKTTEAFIGDGATVDAAANKDGIDVRTGTFGVAFGAYPDADDDVSPVDIDNDDATDASLTQKRTATAGTRSGFKGVAVTAVNQDDIGVFAVGGGLATKVAVQLSATVNVLNADTLAYVGDNARINKAAGGEGSEQSVLVAAGNDYTFLGVAGGVAIAGASRSRRESASSSRRSKRGPAWATRPRWRPCGTSRCAPRRPRTCSRSSPPSRARARRASPGRRRCWC